VGDAFVVKDAFANLQAQFLKEEGVRIGDVESTAEKYEILQLEL
jgi:hypothetical protein